MVSGFLVDLSKKRRGTYKDSSITNSVVLCFSCTAQHQTLSSEYLEQCEDKKDRMYSKLVAALVDPSEQVKGRTCVRLANLQKLRREKKKKGHEIREPRVRTGCLTGLPLLSCSVSIPADLTGGPTTHYHPRHWVRWVRWVRSTVNALCSF